MQVAGVGDMGLELVFNVLNCALPQWVILASKRNGDTFARASTSVNNDSHRDAGLCQLGEINVTQKVGPVECGLTPLTADMSDA